MLKRTISGAVYLAILAVFFVLRELVCEHAFYILLTFLCGYGSFEVARAVKSKSHSSIVPLTLVVGWIFVPLFFALRMIFFKFSYKFLYGKEYACLLIFLLLAVFVWVIITIVKKLDMEKLKWGILPILYPALFFIPMLIIQTFQLKGFYAFLLMFVISPCSDVFAYLIGSLFRGPKLCPKLSPKKTWSGAIGGIFGGVLGSVVLYFILNPYFSVIPAIWVFVLCGVFGSVLTEVGDLFESYIKRKVGIKDMGKIMPGHGGVMDRIDGTLFASLFICLIICFA